ncbi:DUF1304 domain-containing protein [Mesorhizobium sp. M0520]
MVFRLTPEFASASKVLAANQGLYNGFLAAGLIWGFTSAKPVSSSKSSSCSASPAPAITAAPAGRKILVIETVPAVLALIALALG